MLLRKLKNKLKLYKGTIDSYKSKLRRENKSKNYGAKATTRKSKNDTRYGKYEYDKIIEIYRHIRNAILVG